MPRIRLVHWDPGEAEKRAVRLRAAGYKVDCGRVDPRAIRDWGKEPPAAVIVDLSRLPSQGRDLALMLRRQRSTRMIPLLFVEGDPVKVGKIEKLLPDASFTSWRRIRSSLRHTLSHPPEDPRVPPSAMEGYAGATLVKKLGIKAGSVVGVLGGPRDLAKKLGRLPRGATLRRGVKGRPDLVIWFVKSRRELEGKIEKNAAAAQNNDIWIAWPKKASRLAADITQQSVRRTGLRAGLVDYKICALDEDWSALRFTKRKSPNRRS